MTWQAIVLPVVGPRRRTAWRSEKMRIHRGIGAAAFLGIFGLVMLGGCDIVIGIGTYCTEGVDPGCGTTAAGGSTGGTGGQGGSTVGGTGGQGGTSTSGGGTGGVTECSSGATQDCYSGPDGTLGVGICQGGTQMCESDGTWGACDGEVLPDVETCVSNQNEDCDATECALWSTIFGDGDEQLPLGVAVDSQGNVVVLGAFKGTIQLGGDSLTASGAGTRDLFLAKFSSKGDYIWGQRYGDSSDQYRASLTLDHDDNIILAGTFVGALDFGGKMLSAVPGGTDIFVAKLTPGGALVWSEQYGDAADQSAEGVAVDAGGGAHVIGQFAGTLTFFNAITAMNGSDVYVARFSGSNGLPTGQLRFDDKTVQNGSLNIAAGPAGGWTMCGSHGDGAVIAGATLNGLGIFVARYDAVENPVWSVNVPGAAPSGLISNADGNTVLTAHFFNTLTIGGNMLSSKGMADIVVSSLAAADGSVQWAKAYGGAGSDQVARLTADTAGNLYLALTAEDSIDFGGGMLQGKGLNDLFVVGLNPDGTHRWSRLFGDATSQQAQRIASPTTGLGLAVTIETSGAIDFGAGLQQSNGNDVVVAKLAP